MLTLPKNDADKEKVRKTCCAFANADGGFLVYGVMDKKETKHKPLDRIVGIEPTMDFPEHFGDYPKKCVPSIDWEFLNPAIPLRNGQVIHVVHIPKSWKAPHCVIDNNNKMLFMKRTNKGNEDMDYGEVKQMFLGYYEKVLKLQLLKAELINIVETVKLLPIPEQEVKSRYSVSTVNTQILQSILSDTYSILYQCSEIIPLLLAIRNDATELNNKCNQNILIAELPFNNIAEKLVRHNCFVIEKCNQILPKATRAIQLINNIINS